MRRPARLAAVETLRLAADALREPAAARALGELLLRLARALRQRRLAPAPVERMIPLLGTQP